MKKFRYIIAALAAALCLTAAAPSAFAVDANLAKQTVPSHPWPQGDCNADWGVINGNHFWACAAYNVNGAWQPGTGTTVQYIDPGRSFVRVYYYKNSWAGYYHCHTTVIASDPFNWTYYTYGIEYRSRSCD